MHIRTYLSDDDGENHVLRAFHEGCGEFLTDRILTDLGDYQPSDVAVVFGTYKKHVARSYARGAVVKAQKDAGLTTVIIETGYINRGSGPNNHYAVGLNAINGRADFRNKNSPDDRVKKLGVITGEWRSGDHIVLCGQVPWDASVDFSDHKAWLELAVRNIHLRTDRPVIFRPHPLCKLNPLKGTVYSTRPLEHDLRHAHCCVTFNSNSGVEAVIDGVPTLTFDEGAMAYAVTGHSFDLIEDPPRYDRAQWLNDLAYAQWTPEEMKNGEAWASLKLM